MEGNKDRMKKPNCPKCNEKTFIQDDSFDYGEGHHGSGGTQIIKTLVCSVCDWYDEEGEYDGEYEDE